ncbi:16S rRNA (uracil(1498)-N(3))-methyltransferase [Ferrovum myxofaciens]|jgi:16S rRNA (uracil1498-N3)-methyltransferase|uniref:Ribosomal RNA small subunit methyltransferase E n=2 Tax=root TaxID=1 RepID=A0A8F3DXC3_9PROT|nr:16S rRNA (uracil(1498)-N(3))-methyltransferase [Ferrovum myxofaciens]MBW8028772.1 16S rRNA (uracil(1498)-N(3))-methyltransferase [Ferrovum sp.]KXW58348.1 ribosomal RNA small subunit methyltransferase E [Ferrovum myxofaciens]MBU6994752.1 16S rRNA (uracil(1498)-N(3))-methyltransferase [Ferrovum myxofaciens]NDU89779.1 16S rRNA (uracil(1498)-N(3))-methyltransferase [Ferrovum sp.]QKE38598.1 MAG: 16S rRNA (uracil(1498)-N(3))-methyltransferase [Ferrovum myxofaciens]
MSLPRFYCPDRILLMQGGALPREVAHHAVRVLRREEGEELILFDGQGGEFRTRILTIEGPRVEVTAGVFDSVERESPLQTILIQGLCATEKMDWIFQKAVELGATALWVAPTERSVIRLKGEREARRLEHWHKVILSACAQCGRNRVPELRFFGALHDCWAKLPALGLRLLLNPEGQPGRRADPALSDGTVILLVGPEGGLSAAEIGQAHQAGFVDGRIGPRILRTETAALAVLATLQSRYEDWTL